MMDISHVSCPHVPHARPFRMELILRRDVEEHRSLGVVPAAMGYPDLEEWETVVEWDEPRTGG